MIISKEFTLRLNGKILSNKDYNRYVTKLQYTEDAGTSMTSLLQEFRQIEPILLVSYINKDLSLKSIAIPLSEDDLFNWGYYEPSGDYGKSKFRLISETPDPKFKSWDNKPIVRFRCFNYFYSKMFGKLPNFSTTRLHEYRMYEILESFGDSLSYLYESNYPEISYCDIETDVVGDEFSEPDTAKNAINTISWVEGNACTVFAIKDLTLKEQQSIQNKMTEHMESVIGSRPKYGFIFKKYDSEFEMLLVFLKQYVGPANAITGWNFLGYDWPYIINRFKNLYSSYSLMSPEYIKSITPGEDKLSPNEYVAALIAPTGDYRLRKSKGMWGTRTLEIFVPTHKILFDMMEIYKKWDRFVKVKDNYSLDFAATSILGVAKLPNELGFEEFYKQDYENYVLYNGLDSILVREINVKTRLHEVYLGLANLLHAEPMSVMSPVASTHVSMVIFMYPLNKVFTTRDYVEDSDSNEDVGYEGAFVFPAVGGAYKNVGAYDFASLYPTVIRQFNISPETFKFKDPNFVRSQIRGGFNPKDPATTASGTQQYIPTDDEIKTASGAVYSKTEEGVLPALLSYYYKGRVDAKHIMQLAKAEASRLSAEYERRTGKILKDDSAWGS